MPEKETEYEPVYEFVQDSRLNSIMGYILTVFLAGSTLHYLFSSRFSWFVFSLLVLAIIMVPPLSYRDLEKMVPWELLLLAIFPLALHAVQPQYPPNVLNYISVAAASLIIVAELHMFTDIKMTDWFIVLFVATSTIALSGIWAIIRWYMGSYTSLPITNHPDLMNEFMSAMLAGILFGMLYKFYLRHKKKFKEVS